MIDHLSRSTLVKRHKPRKAHQHPLRDVCVQHERNPPMGFRDLLRKGNADRRPDMRGDTINLIFNSALFLILLSGQVELNPGPPISGSLNLSSIFPCGYCEDPVTWEQRGICCDSCDMWFHKDCVDMGSFTFLAYSTTNVSWICCRCNHSNFDRNSFHSFEIETTNNFDNLNSSGS